MECFSACYGAITYLDRQGFARCWQSQLLFSQFSIFDKDKQLSIFMYFPRSKYTHNGVGILSGIFSLSNRLGIKD